MVSVTAKCGCTSHFLQRKPETPAAHCFLTLLSIFMETLGWHSGDSVISSHEIREQQHCVQVRGSGRRFGLWALQLNGASRPEYGLISKNPAVSLILSSSHLGIHLVIDMNRMCWNSVGERGACRQTCLLMERTQADLREQSHIATWWWMNFQQLLFKSQTNYMHAWNYQGINLINNESKTKNPEGFPN